MVTVLSMQVLISMSYSIMLPSMHQLVTNPTAEEIQESEESAEGEGDHELGNQETEESKGLQVCQQTELHDCINSPRST